MYALTHSRILTRKKYLDISVFVKPKVENILESFSPAFYKNVDSWGQID